MDICILIIIVITKYGDFPVLLVQFIQFGKILCWISELIRLKAGRATADKMTAKPLAKIILNLNFSVKYSY